MTACWGQPNKSGIIHALFEYSPLIAADYRTRQNGNQYSQHHITGYHFPNHNGRRQIKLAQHLQPQRSKSHYTKDQSEHPATSEHSLQRVSADATTAIPPQ